MENSSSSSSPYSYNEMVSFRPLQHSDDDAMMIRAETQMAWQGVVHPFSKLEQVLMKPLADDDIIQVTMSIASRSSSQWLTSNDDNLQFPSGFLLEIVAPHALSLQKLQALLEDWIDHRVVTTPIQGAIWDVFQQSHSHGIYKHHLGLPTVGAAWSADAWHQTMQALLPGTDFFGISALQWSKLLVDGHATHKQFWIQWTPNKKSEQQQQATLGLQWHSQQQAEESSSSDLVQTLLSDTSPAACPLARRVLTRLPPLTMDPPTATLESVLRRPHANSPNHGRFETWFTSTTFEENDCQVELRQRVPHYLEPLWQTLQITTDDDSYKATVKWDEADLSSVLTITSQQKQSLMVSLEYEPAFLSLNDFPGDPNRGRELPPAMATLVCPTTPTTTLYSNSLLVLPPVPDMSMPFNVLSLTCSLYAYLIGTLMTLLVKRVSERIYYQLHPSKKPLPKWRQVKAKILAKFAKHNDDKTDATKSSVAQKEEETTTSDNKTGDKQEEDDRNE